MNKFIEIVTRNVYTAFNDVKAKWKKKINKLSLQLMLFLPTPTGGFFFIQKTSSWNQQAGKCLLI